MTFKNNLNINKVLFILFLAFIGCKSEVKKKTSAPKPKVKINVPDFKADSAYAYIDKQVNFGPRVPNTRAHSECAVFLENKLKSFGADVIVQKATVKAFDGKSLAIKNIIGQINPGQNNRIALFSHWDSRPFADHSENPAARDNPIPGANDGASGVGVLLEMARSMQKNLPNIGVDIIFFDAEDYGQPDHKNLQYIPDMWCLGSQYWSKNLHKKSYYARYGILLDMVGAPNAIFTREGYSMQFAPWLVEKVWGAGTQLGYSNHFDFTETNAITDDHVYVNMYANIPTIDIIHYDPATKTHFGSYWHTENDNMQNIDKNTLKAVGQTLLYVVYHEN